MNISKKDTKKRICGIVILIITIIVLTIHNNNHYLAHKKQKGQFDSLCLNRHDSLFDAIQTNTLAIETLKNIERHMDSMCLDNQKQLLQKIDNLISINQQILEQNKNKKCSISSTIHIAE